MAANCTFRSRRASRRTVTQRTWWAASLLEEAVLKGFPLLLTSAAHAVAAEPIGDVETVARRTAVIRAQTGRRRSSSTVRGDGHAGVSLADADVVVSGGRGVGSAEGFSVIEELAELLGGAVGCSRAVTSAGWRPHTDQVLGQTGTKISPWRSTPRVDQRRDTSTWRGCKGVKRSCSRSTPDVRGPSIRLSADYVGDRATRTRSSRRSRLRSGKRGAPDRRCDRRGGVLGRALDCERARRCSPRPGCSSCSRASLSEPAAPVSRSGDVERRAAQRGRRSCSGSASCSSGRSRG